MRGTVIFKQQDGSLDEEQIKQLPSTKNEQNTKVKQNKNRNYHINVCSEGSVSLPTAKAKVSARNRRLTTEVKVIFDSGSQ